MWKQVIQWFVVATCSASLGFGASQMTMVKEVNAHTIEIQYLKKADEQNRADLTSTQQLIRDVLTANRELIGLIRLQNQIKP